MPRKKQKVITVLGPTTSGKSALAVDLAREFGGEVISADSRQVYRGLDIGTGKITKEEMQGVPHHLLDVADLPNRQAGPSERYTAGDFVRDASAAIADISARDNVPIIAGGTGFYIDALVGTISLPRVPPNEQLRAWLEGKEVDTLFAMLAGKDSRRAAELEAKGEHHLKRRVIRAIEIAEHLGEVPQLPAKVDYDVLWVGIAPERDELREKIQNRLLQRLEDGMLEEVRDLHANGVSWERMEELGLEYRYLSRYLHEQITYDEMVEQLEAKIWQYARRQLTYWRRNDKIQWFRPDQQSVIGDRVKMFLR